MGAARLAPSPTGIAAPLSAMETRSVFAYPGLLIELIDRHWELLYTLLVVVGLVIYVVASHSLHQRRHPAAAIAWDASFATMADPSGRAVAGVHNDAIAAAG